MSEYNCSETVVGHAHQLNEYGLEVIEFDGLVGPFGISCGSFPYSTESLPCDGHARNWRISLLGGSTTEYLVTVCGFAQGSPNAPAGYREVQAAFQGSGTVPIDGLWGQFVQVVVEVTSGPGIACGVSLIPGNVFGITTGVFSESLYVTDKSGCVLSAKYESDSSEMDYRRFVAFDPDVGAIEVLQLPKQGTLKVKYARKMSLVLGSHTHEVTQEPV